MNPILSVESWLPAVSLDLPPEPQTEAERAAAASMDEVIGRWFGGGEDGWPCLSVIERRLLVRELVAAARGRELPPHEEDQPAGIELRSHDC